MYLLRDSLWSELDSRLELATLPVQTGRDLVPYIEGPLNSPLWGGQENIARAVMQYPRTAVASCHAAGKSYLASRVATAYLQQLPKSVVITTAPTGRQVEGVLWRYIRATAAGAKEPLRGKRGHPLSTRWEIEADWYALGFKAADTNADAFQGFHAEHILVIVDEAAGVSETLYEAISGILTGSGARLLLIGNPTSITGTFRDAFHGKSASWHTIKIPADQTPNFTHFGITRADMADGTWRDKVNGRPMPYPGLIDPEYVELWMQDYGPESPVVKSRIWAEFPEGSEDALIALSDLEAAQERMEDDISTDGKAIAGIDVARYGNDKTAIHVRQGELSIDWDAWRGKSLEESRGVIGQWLDRRGYAPTDILLRVDAGGLGSGLAEMLSADGWKVKEVIFGAGPSDTVQFQNLRHEMYWQFGERVREGRFATNGRALPREFIAAAADIRVSYRNPRYTRPLIESKDDMKKRHGGSSPDELEAAVIAYATLPRTPRRKGGAGALAGRVTDVGSFRD